MSWELDHVFFATVDAGAVEAELTAFGFAFTVRRDHPGQGTANACAQFENAFVEILRPRDPEETGIRLGPTTRIGRTNSVARDWRLSVRALLSPNRYSNRTRYLAFRDLALRATLCSHRREHSDRHASASTIRTAPLYFE